MALANWQMPSTDNGEALIRTLGGYPNPVVPCLDLLCSLVKLVQRLTAINLAINMARGAADQSGN